MWVCTLTAHVNYENARLMHQPVGRADPVEGTKERKPNADAWPAFNRINALLKSCHLRSCKTLNPCSPDPEP